MKTAKNKCLKRPINILKLALGVGMEPSPSPTQGVGNSN